MLFQQWGCLVLACWCYPYRLFIFDYFFQVWLWMGEVGSYGHLAQSFWYSFGIMMKLLFTKLSRFWVPNYFFDRKWGEIEKGWGCWVDTKSKKRDFVLNQYSLGSFESSCNLNELFGLKQEWPSKLFALTTVVKVPDEHPNPAKNLPNPYLITWLPI